jgi:hypothetical protein
MHISQLCSVGLRKGKSPIAIYEEKMRIYSDVGEMNSGRLR